MQPKAATNQMFSSCPPPAIILTTTTSSPSSRPSAPTASSVPQPMDLDCTHPVKRDPHHGLCFNCGKPGHITKACQGPCTQNVWNVESSHMDNPVRLPATPPAKTYILLKTSPCSLNLQVELMFPTSLASVTTSALLDSGATGMFINWDFVQRHQLETTPLPQPVLLCNIDGSTNEHGSIMEE